MSEELKVHEMLTLSAKAQGLETILKPRNGIYQLHIKTGNTKLDEANYLIEEWRPWNPLDDDGDALRLAVHLDIDVSFDDWHVIADYKLGSCAAMEGVAYEGDKNAATRRAIVGAASQIGRMVK